MTSRELFLMRMRGILRKEMLQIRRDPSSIALALVLPMVLLFIFGYGVSLDAENVPIAMVIEDSSQPARDLAARFEGSAYFKVTYLKTMADATRRLNNGKIDAIINLQNDFLQRLNKEALTPIQLIVNCVDANRARLIQGYVHSILYNWSAQNQVRGQPARRPAVTISPRIWFNQAAVSRNFLVPGLITLIMTLTGILLTALVVAREWERGTMEAILVTPLRRGELLLGKVLPYYLLGMLGMGLSVVAAITIFDVPMRGSLLAFFFLSSLFMLASSGFGLLISAAIKVQFVAAQTSIVAGFLPAFFLSGLIFDLESTPIFIRTISHVVPARYYVSISHTLFMAGDLWGVLWPNALALALMALFFLRLAYGKITKRLEG
jgi:ABC-2 type transport system permease protein